ncbi:sodium:solute symporter family protein [Companilactobacillus jidongensis]|uniref:sodium:solute symporter family protein n=1 Tax=Companilactobacillus jidongensis TaxID=2486006 RepID=UPI000F791F8E|nr:sodium:solute symporter family protein [Companilactobacillus jidongensis]
MHMLSSNDTLIVMGMILVYILITGYLSFRWGGSTNEDFMRASNKLPTFVLGILLMSEYIGAQSTVGTAQSAFSNGVAASWAIVAAVIGFILYGLFFVKRLYNTGGFTISSAVEQQYGHSTKIIVSIIMIYALFLVNVGNYISGAGVLVQILGIKLPIAMVIVGIVSTIYFSFGGMKSVAYVSVIHTFVKYIGILITLAFALVLTHGISPMVTKMPHFYFTLNGHIGWGTIIGWILTTVGAVFSTQFLVQAISSAKNAKAAQHASYLAAGLFIPLAIAIGLIGVAAKFLFPTMNGLYALPVFLTHMNVFLAGFVATALVASVFVSVSSVALGLVALIVDDFYVPMRHPEPKQQLRMTRILSVIVGFLPLIFSFIVPQILQLSFFSKALRMSITVVAISGFYLPHFGSTRSANVALIGTAVLATAWFLMGDPFGIDNVYISIFAPMILMGLCKLWDMMTGKGNPPDPKIDKS